jgi:ABC-type uncharacterized transport system auxiliary subunit
MRLADRRRAIVLGAGLPLALGGCTGLLAARNAPPPAEYTLTGTPSLPEDLPRRDWVLLVAEPNAEGSLDTSRITMLADGRVERLAGVVWSDRATVMLQFLIVKAFQGADRLRAIGTDRDDLPGRYLLQTTLNDFQIEPEGAAYAAQVNLNARLLALPTREVAGARDFSQRVLATAASNDAAVAAFDEAVASILGEIVAWTLRTGRAR